VRGGETNFYKAMDGKGFKGVFETSILDSEGNTNGQFKLCGGKS